MKFRFGKKKGSRRAVSNLMTGGWRGFNLANDRGLVDADYETMRIYGANLARVSLRATLAGNTYSIAQSEYNYVDFALLMGAKYGFNVVITLATLPGGELDTFWGDTAKSASLVSLWTSIATRYSGNINVAGYDLLNEPVQPKDRTVPVGSTEYWWNNSNSGLALTMIDAIRAIDTNAICILELSPYARLTATYSNLVPIPRPNIVYSFHFYDSQDLTHQGLPGFPTARTYPGTYPYNKQYMLDVLAWLINFNNNYPGHTFYCGEFSFIRTGGATNGDGSPQRWITDFLAEMGIRKYNYTYHAFREYEGWDAEVPSGALGSPAARSGTAPTISILKNNFLSGQEFNPPGLVVGNNSGGISVFGGTEYFIDKVKQVPELWLDSGFVSIPRADARLNANHFPSNLGIGQSALIPIWNGLDDLRQTIKKKAGTWIISWDQVGGGGVTVEFILTDGITGTTSGTGTSFNFTVASTSSSLWVQVTNSTGVAGRGITNLRIRHSTHDAALTAGEVFDPDYIAHIALSTNMRFVRFLDWQNTNVGSQTDVDTITPMSYQSWGRSDRGIPPEIIGLLAKKLREVMGRNVDMWAVMGRACTNAYMTEFYTRMFNADPTGNWTLHCEGVNEVWNFGFQSGGLAHFTWFDTVYFPANGLTAYDDNNAISNTGQHRSVAGYTHHAMRCWAAADAVFGSSRVRPVIGVQTGFYALMSMWIHQRTPGLLSGATAMSVVNTRGRLAYTMYWQIFGAITMKQHLINDIGSASEASILTQMQASIDNVKNNEIITSTNNYRGKGLTARITMYEGNSDDFWDKHSNLSGHPADFNGTVSGATIVMADGTAHITNGDLWTAPNQGAVNGLNFPFHFFVRKTGAASIRCYATQAAYDGDAGNTGVGAATLNAGTFYFAPQTRFKRWADKLHDILSGNTGLSAYQYAVAAVQNASINCDTFAIFAYSSSSAKSGNGRFSYSFDSYNSGIYAPALTPGAIYLNGLTGA